MERLTVRDSTNTQWQNGLAISHEAIGDVLVAQGDLTSASSSFRKSLEIGRSWLQVIRPKRIGRTTWRLATFGSGMC
jgi:hypothetical protein